MNIVSAIDNQTISFSDSRQVRSGETSQRCALTAHARQAKWAGEKDGWLHGYWGFDWADNYVRIRSINTENKTIVTDPATPPIYGFHEKVVRNRGPVHIRH
jgi:hypothetical protein